jgi:hypothetical protein
MISPSSVFAFQHVPKRDFRFERYEIRGTKVWRVSCQFDLMIQLDPTLAAVELAQIEYRQFISGGVWFRRGALPWTADNNPNGNASFKIPPYAGQSRVAGIPAKAVPGQGLSLMEWKEDGEVDRNGTERYGYRNSTPTNLSDEVDRWTPTQASGFCYNLRDTPSFAAPWANLDLSVEVWVELYFKGFVVQVEQDENLNTQPIKVLKQTSWKYFWPEKKLLKWTDAIPIPVPR